MKKLITISFLACAFAAASEMESMHVTIPFTFTAGSATLPAGEYTITQQTDGRILTIGGKGGGAILVSMPQDIVGESVASNLKFASTVKGHMLLAVQMNGKPTVILQRK